MVALLAIALVFPFTVWLMSRKRILGLSGLSDELAATLLTVEERQPKLADILKEIQGEVDYLHTVSAPELKALIAQAEKYLEQNERDLEKAGSGNGRGKAARNLLRRATNHSVRLTRNSSGNILWEISAAELSKSTGWRFSRFCHLDWQPNPLCLRTARP